MKERRFALFSWGVLAYTVGVILWGAFVRATGSGAGCGSHWPLCNGVVVPREPEIATLIELTHRATSGLAVILVAVLLVWALRLFPPRHPVRLGAALVVIFMVLEALIGAGLVLFELVADNDSMARALFMAVHLMNTFLLLGFMTLTSWWASGGPPLDLRRRGLQAALFTAALAGFLLVGASGAVAALGDTLFPSRSLAEALRAELSVTSHVLIRLRIFHPLIALVVSAFILLAAGAYLRRPQGEPAPSFARALIVLVFLQLTAGLVNVILLAPVWMQILHLFLSDVMWVVLVLWAASALAAPAAVLEGKPARPVLDAGRRVRTPA